MLCILDAGLLLLPWPYEPVGYTATLEDDKSMLEELVMLWMGIECVWIVVVPFSVQRLVKVVYCVSGGIEWLVVGGFVVMLSLGELPP